MTDYGWAVTDFMRLGDMVRMEMVDGSSKSVFGTIEQKVARLER
jgi:fumarylacetoacetate (FAA) hydrolase